jgi:hypothetical protein
MLGFRQGVGSGEEGRTVMDSEGLDSKGARG